MIWRLEFSKKAEKQLSKMNETTRRILVAWLIKNIDGCENPRAQGKGLVANHSGEWRYRVGDYRILCDIQDARLVVLAFNIEHRSTVYR